eukprot:COSAG01_NODE_63334_length_280_cov_0.944751_1_plen_44_part_10
MRYVRKSPLGGALDREMYAIEGKPTCPQNHKLDPYESPLVLYYG